MTEYLDVLHVFHDPALGAAPAKHELEQVLLVTGQLLRELGSRHRMWILQAAAPPSSRRLSHTLSSGPRACASVMRATQPGFCQF